MDPSIPSSSKHTEIEEGPPELLSESEWFSDDSDSVGDGEEEFVESEIARSEFGEITRVTGELNIINEYYNKNLPVVEPPRVSQPVPRNKYDEPQLLRNMMFKDKSNAQYCISHYHIVLGYRFRVLRSNPTLWVVRCYKVAQTGCDWQCRVMKGKREAIWHISQYNGRHTCPVGEIGDVHPNLTKYVVGNKLMDRVIQHGGLLSVEEAQNAIRSKFGYRVPYKKAWFGVQRTFELVYGSWESSIQSLPSFLTALVDSNPGTIVKMSMVNTVQGHGHLMLHNIFWAFRPYLDVYRHCDPVICVVATHLYSKYDHKLMVAVSKDGDGHLVPLCYGLVDTEDESSCHWFMECIDLHVVDDRPTCIISDESSGMKVAVKNMSSFSQGRLHHRYCLRHVVSNFNKKFGNEELKKIAYRAGCASLAVDFWAELELIRAQNQRAYKWLADRDIEKWTAAFDGGFRCGNMTTNMVECMNNVLKGVRRLPLKFIIYQSYMKSRRAKGNLRSAYYTSDFNVIDNEDNLDIPRWTLCHNPRRKKSKKVGRKKKT